MIIVSVILTLIIIFIIGYCLRTIFTWVDSWATTDHIIEFEEFKSLYAVNSKRWELMQGVVKCLKHPDGYTYMTYSGYVLRFTFTDYLKYKVWKEDLNRKHEKSLASKEYQEFREAIAQDLKKIKE